MGAYRIKTESEFKRGGLWTYFDDNAPSKGGYPDCWDSDGDQNKWMGRRVPDAYIEDCQNDSYFSFEDEETGYFFEFRWDDYIFDYSLPEMINGEITKDFCIENVQEIKI